MFKIKFAFILLLLFFVHCSDSVNESNPEEENENYSEELSKYFPTSFGTSLSYSVDTLDQTKNIYKNIGKRSFSVDSKKYFKDIEYFVCNQIYNFEKYDLERSLKFRIGENSILVFTDTCQISESIPDSLSGKLSIFIEPEINLLQFPLEKKKPWHVIEANVDFGSFKFNILDISAEYIGNEILTFDNYSESLYADRIRYRLDVNIPELANPFLSEISTYNADVWFVPGMGIVKLEGCSLFINPVTGQHIDFSDSNKVSRHTLINF